MSDGCLALLKLTAVCCPPSPPPPNACCTNKKFRSIVFSTLGRSWADIGLAYNPVLNNSVLANIAASYDTSVAQVVLRWAMWENVVVVPRSSDFKHIALNFAAQYTPLNARDVHVIRELQGQIDEDEIAAAIEKTVSCFQDYGLDWG